MIKEKLARFIKKELVTLEDQAVVRDFNREIEECFEYFENNGQSFTNNKHQKLTLIHGNKVEIGRLKNKDKEYFLIKESGLELGHPFFKQLYKVDKGRLFRSKKSYSKPSDADYLNSEPVDRKGLEQIIKEIHNITIPYRKHIDSKSKNRH